MQQAYAGRQAGCRRQPAALVGVGLLAPGAILARSQLKVGVAVAAGVLVVRVAARGGGRAWRRRWLVARQLQHAPSGWGGGGA
jgi:hypothetical protein